MKALKLGSIKKQETGWEGMRKNSQGKNTANKHIEHSCSIYKFIFGLQYHERLDLVKGWVYNLTSEQYIKYLLY